MKKAIVFALLITLLLPVIVLAQEGVPSIDLGGIEEYVAAVGIGAILTLVVEILKRAGAIPDGQAGVWATAANLVVFAGLYIGGIFGFDVEGGMAQNIIAIVEQVGKLVLMIMSSLGSFQQLRGAAVLKPLPARKES